jgi:hypothetical protein
MAATLPFDDFVERSSLVFRGTVEKVKVSSVPNLPVTDRTVLVRIDQVFRAPEVLGDLTGKQITVELSGSSAPVGQSLMLFTVPIVFADNIAVREVGRMETPPEATRQREHADGVSAAIQQLPDKRLQRHVLDADVVVTGKILSVTPRKTLPEAGVSEHDPDWREAVIEVYSVERGNVPSNRFSLLFAGSRDVQWYGSPKFEVGQEGVFVLHRQQIRELKTEHHVAIHSLDFHPLERREHIRALLQNR